MYGIFNSFDEQLDDLLQKICENTQVSKTEFDRAQSSYEAIAKWLGDAPEGSLLFHSNPKLYPQGSLRLGTAVKPIGRNEFDVDLVCEFQLDWRLVSPQALLQAVYDRLAEHEVYRRMLPPRLEPGRRCVTLTYKNEFHIDILPACPDNLGISNGHIRVACKQIVGAWKDSNPRGYGIWFDERSEEYPEAFRNYLRKALIDDFPDHEAYEVKTPLQRNVQVLKRWRDVAFEKSSDPKKNPISVVITTLTAMSYRGETSINIATQRMLSALNEMILRGQRILVFNPANPKENFAESWETIPGSYGTFIEWIQESHRRWEELNQLRGGKLGAALKEMFGPAVTDEAIKKQVRLIEKSRTSDQLGLSRTSGFFSIGSAAAAVPVKANTFFGE